MDVILHQILKPPKTIEKNGHPIRHNAEDIFAELFQQPRWGQEHGPGVNKKIATEIMDWIVKLQS